MARQAAAVVLSDDNFSNVVEALAEGRRLIDNLVCYCPCYGFSVLCTSLVNDLLSTPRFAVG